MLLGALLLVKRPEKDDQEMEATVFNSQETSSGPFTPWEPETEENSGKVASWEFLTALSLIQDTLFNVGYIIFELTLNSH